MPDNTTVLDRHQRDGQPAIVPECIHQVGFLWATKGEGVDVMNGGSITRHFRANGQHAVILCARGYTPDDSDTQIHTAPIPPPDPSETLPGADIQSSPRQ